MTDQEYMVRRITEGKEALFERMQKAEQEVTSIRAIMSGMDKYGRELMQGAYKYSLAKHDLLWKTLGDFALCGEYWDWKQE